jgi:UDP-3-O-[3-hydroxymyristoyl] N-acetylglucosamine deacetylase
MGVDNALVEVEGGEAPILDGSARAFAQDIVEVGLRRFDVERREIVILRPVRVSLGDSFAELAPGDDGLTLDVEIDFAHSAIGRQRFYGALSPEMFARELAGARTFGFVRDVERLWSLGLARGAGLENTIVLDEKRVMNDGGLRFADEFVRHKALDAVGDLALAGAPLRGAFRSRRSGHALNVAVLKALFADPKAWAIRGAAPLRRAPLRPDFGMRLAPTFAPVL